MTDTAQTLSKLRTYAGFTLSTALWLLAGGLLSCQAVIWLKPLSPGLSLIEQFAVHLLSLAAIGLALALVLRSWSQAAAFAILALTLAWPVFAAHRAGIVVADDRALKVVSANLWFAAPTHQRTIEFLMASDADIIGLIEVSTPWQQALAPLFAKYPYKVDCFATVPECETILLSKLPITAPRAERVLGGAPVVVGGEVDWNGRRFEVLATHLAWPFTPDAEQRWRVVTDPAAIPTLEGRLPATRQASQAHNLAKFVNTLPADLVVMGDFNGAPWSRLQIAFSSATGLESAAGWELSWPTMLPWPLRLPIDHVLSRGHLAVTDFSAGPEIDSDHFPVIAEIGWRD
jgi:endonuclease/exonuclease/phosphatase (EEP) superfamily protein YafD